MDKVLINSQEIVEFLDDFKKNSVTEILEEGKEKNELIKIAKKYGVDLKGNPDLAMFKNIYGLTGKANLNKCRLIKEIIIKRLHTLSQKPIDIDHERDYVTGHYLEGKVEGDEIITYGFFYKSNFEKEWEHAKELFKKGKLTTSFEIWNPEEKRTYHEDGTFDLADENLHLAGGAILFKTKPAFKEARVLEIAKRKCVGNHCDMVFASDKKFDQKDLITSTIEIIEPKVIVEKKTIEQEVWICPHCGKEIGEKELYLNPDGNKFIHRPCNGEVILPKLEDSRDGKGKGKPKQKDGGTKYCVCLKCGYYKDHKRGESCLELECPKCGTKLVGKNEKPKIDKSEVTTIEKPDEKTGIKTTCQNCNYVFEWDKVLEFKPAVKKCPKCQAVINKEGKVLQIPQRIDFKISCPECDSSMSWEILERSEDKIKVRCSNCNKAYELTFDKKEDPFVGKFFKLTRYFNYITEKMKGCKQCGHKTEITAVDFDKNELEVRCANCGLKYRVNYLKARNKRIIEVKEIELSSIIENIVGELDKRRENLMEREIILEDLKDEELKSFKSSVEADEKDEGIEEGKKLTYEERQKLPDSMFALIQYVKDKRTGEKRKIRRFPINDEAHVRNALARLPVAKDLTPEERKSVRRKILKRARQLKMTTLLERYKKGSELDLSKLPKEVTDCVKKKIKAGTKPTIAVKECWAEYKKAKGSVEDKDEFAISEVIEDFENQLALSEIIDKEEDAMTDEEKRALAERAKVVGLKEDASKEEVEKAEAKKKDLEHYEKENEDAKKAKLVERAKAVSLKEDATEEEIVKAEKAKADKAKTDELTKLKKEIEDLKKALKAKDAEIEKVRKDTAKLTARKIKLGEEKAKEMKDEDILNDDKFEKETLKIEKANLEKQLKDNKILPSGHEPEGEEKDALEVANEYVNGLAYGTEESQE